MNPLSLAKAFRQGMAFSKGRKHKVIAEDEAKWITVHPNGTGNYTTWKADENGEEVYPPLWVPKSQVTASSDKKSVYGMAKWLMKRQKIKSWDNVNKKRKPNQSKTASIRLGNAGTSSGRFGVDR